MSADKPRPRRCQPRTHESSEVPPWGFGERDDEGGDAQQHDAEGEGEGDAPGLMLHEHAVRAAVARMKTSVNNSFLFKGFASFGPYCAPCASVAYLKRCKFFLLPAPLQKAVPACIIG